MERIENISKDQVDTLVKDSFIIFKKINKKKIFKKVILTCIGTFLFVFLGYGVYIGIAKEFFHGNVPIAPGIYVEVPTKNSNEAKQNIKKFIKAFVKKDYDVIDKMLEKYLVGKDNNQDNIAKYNEYLKDYYDTFTIDNYETYNDCYYNGRYYVVEYTIYLKYRGTRFITYVQLGYDNGNVYLHALGYENEDAITEGLIGENNSVLMQKLLNVFSDYNVRTNLGLDLVD